MIGSKNAPPLRKTAILALLAIAFSTVAVGATAWQLDRGPSAVSFTVSHLVFSEVEGRFTRFTGSVDLPGEELEEARIEADIDSASIHTGHEDRDRHLVSDEFLSADAFPRIHFVSRTISRTGTDSYQIIGDLTIRDTTHEIVLAARSMGRRETTAGARLDFQATGSINRYDYGLRWNKIWDGSAVLGEQVEISLEVCLVEDVQPPG